MNETPIRISGVRETINIFFFCEFLHLQLHSLLAGNQSPFVSAPVRRACCGPITAGGSAPIYRSAGHPQVMRNARRNHHLLEMLSSRVSDEWVPCRRENIRFLITMRKKILDLRKRWNIDERGYLFRRWKKETNDLWDIN